jgi:sigma-B regulation protein RsbU (phosphoserine phosphatase)
MVAENVWVDTSLTMLAGDRITFVSDGVIEAANAHGELFGLDQTREISMKPAQVIAATAQEWGQDDDITVVQVAYA